jgi:hypothetical protein
MREHLAVSQFPSECPIQSKDFPQRNRAMALIADASVITDLQGFAGGIGNDSVKRLAWHAGKESNRIPLHDAITPWNYVDLLHGAPREPISCSAWSPVRLPRMAKLPGDCSL